MDSIVIGPRTVSRDGKRVDVEIATRGDRFQLYFQTKDINLHPFSEAFVSVTLLPAMKLRISQIEINDNISEVFLAGLEQIQNVFQEWKPGYGRVSIKTTGLSKEIPAKSKRKQGVFFSAGVDSFHTFLSRKDDVDALVYLDGFDIPLNEILARERMKQNLEAIQERFSKQIISIETNARDYLERYLSWTLGHGSAIAGVGHLLASEFSCFLIASGGNPRSGRPFGVHPRLDPNWSSEHVEFIHDSYYVDRIEKIRVISQFEGVQDTLRVCLRYPKHGLNCGECEKCLRTMVYLQVTGGYERSRAFEKPLDLRLLSRYKRITGPERDLLYPALQMLEEQGTYPETAAVLKEILYPPGWKQRLILTGRKTRRWISKIAHR